MKRVKEVTVELYNKVSGDEKALVDAMLNIVGEYGKFQSEGSMINAGYDNAQNNPNLAIGVKCGNCVFHMGEGENIECSAVDIDIEEDGACRFAAIPPGIVTPRESLKEAGPTDLRVGNLVSWRSSGGTAKGKIARIERNGSINVPGSSFTINGTKEDPAALITLWREGPDGWAETDTKVGHRFSTLKKISSLSESVKFLEAVDTYNPPAGVQSAAKRALKWIGEGYAGDGFTSVGRRRASQLASGQSVSRDTVARMKSYFARHTVDKKATGFNAGQEGYPSPGRVAWDAWGGTAGQAWVNRIKLDKKENK